MAAMGTAALVVALAGTVLWPEDPDPTAQSHFDKGKQLVESNCGECMGSTRSGLELGIAEVQKALELGYGDRVAAYKLLGQAYNTLALVFVTPDSGEQERAFNERGKVYEKLLEINPADPETRFLYGSSLRDRDAQLTQYRKVLELQPDHTDARFGVGMILISEGRLEEGIAELRKAFTLARGADRVEAYGRILAQQLRRTGRQREAGEVLKQVKAKTGSGKPDRP